MYKLHLGDPNHRPEIFHYDVEIASRKNPDKSTPIAIVRGIWDQLRNKNPQLAHFLKVVSPARSNYLVVFTI